MTQFQKATSETAELFALVSALISRELDSPDSNRLSRVEILVLPFLTSVYSGPVCIFDSITLT